MAKEAEAHADEDKKKRELVEARNILDNTIYQAEKMLREYKDKLSEEDSKKLQEAIDGARKNSTEDSSEKEISGEEIAKATEALNEVMMPIGAKMYESIKDEAPVEDAAPEEDAKSSDKAGTKKSGKKPKDGPVEGEVVDEK